MKLFICLFFMLSSVSANAATNIQSIAPHGHVSFEAIGRPSMLKIKGEGDGAIADLKVDDHKVNGTIKFDLNALKTGIELRDEHMKEKYLQVKQSDFSTAVMTFTDFPIPLSWSAKEAKVASWTFQATLKLHGVQNSITGTYSIGTNKMDMQAKFDIKLSDYKIDIPTYLGVKVADVVNVTVTFPEMKISEVASPSPAPAPAAEKAPIKAKKK